MNKLLLIIFALFINIATMNFTNANLTPSQDEIIKAALKEVVRQLNEQMPIPIDDLTLLRNVVAIDKILTYNYELIGIRYQDLTAQEWGQVKSEMISQSINTVCYSNETKLLLDWGVKINSIYKDGNGRVVFIIPITANNCR